MTRPLLHRLAGALAFVALMSASFDASAQRKQPTEIDKDAARAAIHQGDEKMKQEDFAGALEAYKRADDIMGVPTTTLEVGQAHLALGNLVEAYEAFRRCARYPKREGEPAPFAEARETARAVANGLKGRIPTLSIVVKGASQQEVAITLDGRAAQHAWDGPIRLNPGDHKATVEGKGFVPQAKRVTLKDGQRGELAFEMERVATPTGEGDDWMPLVYGGGGALVLGAALGTITGVMSMSAASEAESDPARCQNGVCAPGALDDASNLAHVSTAGFVLAGVGAAVGAVGLVLTFGADEGPVPEKGVSFAPGLGGVVATGRF